MEGERDAALAGVEQRTHLSEELERAVHPAATLPCNNIQPLRKPAAPLRTHAHARTHARTQAETPGRCCRCGRACVRRTRTSDHRPPSSRRPCRSRPGTALRVSASSARCMARSSLAVARAWLRPAARGGAGAGERAEPGGRRGLPLVAEAGAMSSDAPKCSLSATILCWRRYAAVTPSKIGNRRSKRNVRCTRTSSASSSGSERTASASIRAALPVYCSRKI